MRVERVRKVVAVDKAAAADMVAVDMVDPADKAAAVAGAVVDIAGKGEFAAHGSYPDYGNNNPLRRRAYPAHTKELDICRELYRLCLSYHLRWSTDNYCQSRYNHIWYILWTDQIHNDFFRLLHRKFHWWMVYIFPDFYYSSFQILDAVLHSQKLLAVQAYIYQDLIDKKPHIPQLSLVFH